MIWPFSKIFQRLTVPWIIDRFGRKRNQMKRNSMGYKSYYQFFSICMLFDRNCRPSNIRSIHTYRLWSKVDSCFCEFLYMCILQNSCMNVMLSILKHVPGFLTGFFYGFKNFSDFYSVHIFWIILLKSVWFPFFPDFFRLFTDFSRIFHGFLFFY